ncbi:MAG: hypothetical protein IT198_13385 [Acidimicrobiia bacterium]|nr:hypothetical protein [Acidimicrobiia bacterium]
MISPEDEALHPAGDLPHWQESFYFNWSDPEREVLGLARIGYRFADDRVDGLVLSIRGGRPEFCYPAVNLRRQGPWTDQNPDKGFRAGRLVFEILEPLSRFRLRLDGTHSMDLVWEATTPPLDFGDSQGSFRSEMAAEHFEQAGTVRGWTEFRGHRSDVDGRGQRDKSWGPRDWGSLVGWDWVSGQFEDGTAFNATRVRGPDGTVVPAGFVHHDGETRHLTDIAIDYTWGRRPHLPESARLVLTDSAGVDWRVQATALGRCPLARNGAWLEEIRARFEMDGGPAGTTVSGPGHGVIEHVWRPRRLGMIGLLPELWPLVRSTVRP